MKKLLLLIALGVGMGLAGCGAIPASPKGPLIVTYHSYGIVRCK